MTFARVTTARKWAKTAHFMRAVWGCQRVRLPHMSGSVWEIATLTRAGTDEYDAGEMPSEPEGTIVSDSSPSAASGPNRPSAQRRVRCPTCGRAALWSNNPQRPFCSRTCRLVDLGVWLDEGYVVRGEDPDDVQ
jgi:endogenous inhibitor of DNA gyrase (YacG/DUF329 family)